MLFRHNNYLLFFQCCGAKFCHICLWLQLWFRYIQYLLWDERIKQIFPAAPVLCNIGCNLCGIYQHLLMVSRIQGMKDSILRRNNKL